MAAATVWVLTDAGYLAQRMPAALLESLSERGVRARVLVADDIVARPDERRELDPWSGACQGDVVVARTRNRFALALLPLAERPGITVVTPWEPIATVRDKPRVAAVLAQHGLPAPRTYLAACPGSLEALPRSAFPLLLKPHTGDNGRGIVRVDEPAELADLGWSDSMVLAQEYVECGGVDHKVYVAGDRVWLVRRPSPLRPTTAGEDDGAVEAVEPSPELRRLARECGRVFGLTLFGVDVVCSRRGPLIVDVNEFPNYTGVAEAPQAIAELIVRRLSSRRSA